MPQVSIIIPCFNEQATIRLLLSAIYDQQFPREKMEVIIADGMSTDRTREEITQFQETYSDIKIMVVDNHKRNIPSGLNRAIEAASGEYIVRMDAHSVPAADYVARCIDLLRQDSGENVGGIWEIRPNGEGWIPKSIALAAAHPFGVGDAHYRLGGVPREVDTVPFGAFRRSMIRKIGLFDENLLSNEDYEFNARIKKAGGVIWLDPGIRSTYFARADFNALAKQYWRYGYWKARMLVRYPETFRWRQLAGAFVLTWIVLGALSIGFPIARWLLLLEAGLYSTVLFIAGYKPALIQRDIRFLFGVPVAIATMHFSWGSGFIWSFLGMFGKLLRRGSFQTGL